MVRPMPREIHLQPGDKFGRLTLLELTTRGARNEKAWHCLCSCGRRTTPLQANLRSGASQSCGCLSRDNANPIGLGSGWQATCVTCGKAFRSRSNKQTACSDDCRFLHYQNAASATLCWEWSGNRNNQGYGVLQRGRDKKMIGAHRYSYERANGPIPKGMCVMHSCDNPGCVNPAHLSIGTWGDNNRDRSAKGRSGARTYTPEQRATYSRRFCGEGNVGAKLTNALVIEIRQGHPDKSGAQLARELGLSKAVVNSVRRGATWRHVQPIEGVA